MISDGASGCELVCEGDACDTQERGMLFGLDQYGLNATTGQIVDHRPMQGQGSDVGMVTMARLESR